MDKAKINFLLDYAKIGVLSEMKNMDEIEAEEIKQKYMQIKKEVKEGSETIEKSTQKKETGKDGPVKKWFSGIGDRQKKYQESKKGGLM